MERLARGIIAGAALTALPVGAEAYADGYENAQDQPCVHTLQPGETFSSVSNASPWIQFEQMVAENAWQVPDPNNVAVGTPLDICAGDVPPYVPPYPNYAYGVAAQQQKVNELLAQFGFPALEVDGISGPLTEQGLCAAALVTGQYVLRDDIEPGSYEEHAMMAASEIYMPQVDYFRQEMVKSSRWILLNQTCQVAFVGEYDQVRYIFPISTGSGVPDADGFPTETINGAGPAERYNPASDNDGWHNSTDYPVGPDDARHGNMYKPIYFNGGQALHGSDFVPPYPASKGCARIAPEHQNAIIDFLGFEGFTQPTWAYNLPYVEIVREGRYIEDID